jgi:hypothetical protein
MIKISKPDNKFYEKLDNYDKFVIHIQNASEKLDKAAEEIYNYNTSQLSNQARTL